MLFEDFHHDQEYFEKKTTVFENVIRLCDNLFDKHIRFDKLFDKYARYDKLFDKHIRCVKLFDKQFQ